MIEITGQCSFCEEAAVKGGTEIKFCAYHDGFMHGTMAVLERYYRIPWQDAEEIALKITSDPLSYLRDVRVNGEYRHER